MKTISNADYEELRDCISLIVLRLVEHRDRDNAKGESLYRAEEQADKALRIMERLEGNGSS